MGSLSSILPPKKSRLSFQSLCYKTTVMEWGRQSRQAHPVTRERVLGVLALGFAIVITALLAAAYIGWQNTGLMQEAAANLSDEQWATLEMIDRIQRGQVTLRLIVFRIIQDPGSVDSEEILALLDQADSEMKQDMPPSAPRTGLARARGRRGRFHRRSPPRACPRPTPRPRTPPACFTTRNR